jgi:hypothetical protein
MTAPAESSERRASVRPELSMVLRKCEDGAETRPSDSMRSTSLLVRRAATIMGPRLCRSCAACNLTFNC